MERTMLDLLLWVRSRLSLQLSLKEHTLTTTTNSTGTVQDGYPDQYPLDFPNPFEWCDMSNPFFNPFCPTANPWFNILIKFMIPGAIRPFIDQITNALTKGQQFMIMLTKCMIPPIDGTGPRGGPPGFIEISSRDAAISKGLAQISNVHQGTCSYVSMTRLLK